MLFYEEETNQNQINAAPVIISFLFSINFYMSRNNDNYTLYLFFFFFNKNIVHFTLKKEKKKKTKDTWCVQKDGIRKSASEITPRK